MRNTCIDDVKMVDLQRRSITGKGVLN